MARLTNAELAALVQQLQEENERLRAEVQVAETAPAVSADVGAPAARRRRGRGRTVASVALVVIGLVLAPVAIAANWAESQLADTEAFVGTFAPLAQDPAVRAFVI